MMPTRVVRDQHVDRYRSSYMVSVGSPSYAPTLKRRTMWVRLPASAELLVVVVLDPVKFHEGQFALARS
jgi:hypothetical protein